ncbi:LacI family DNA-binding transcriptional regulator [Streptomyces sp. NBC_01262]|jgi:DNA-binding LacI/PurR family transcriptional regulator|uniref:LacI family DNA-binding transcriptional regulator n=1 Tax=Streptomyces sp. NBC_01262 TaxID=2903803 RepID=UPI002E30FAEF|nr:LacI family DNA-binding transcriptional regulator [Streptomyces sp. NBC_01262]
MADVATLAGVSHQTVSRVLGNHPNVREATRLTVLRAIEELGYRRNSSARALATRRTRTVGVVASDTTLFGPASTLFGLEEAARAEGYTVSTVSLRRLDGATLSGALEHLSDGGVEGVVVIAPHRPAVSALAELRYPFPVVTVEGGHDLDIPCVSVDQHLGARLATDHLLAAGHRTVWHVAGPEDWLEAGARTAGWRAALEAAGAAVPPMLTGDWSPLSGYRAGQELAGRAGRGMTAVFVSNDQMALGVLRAFREAGVRVPGDVALVGFDDIPESEFFAPPLTTVRQDFMAVGKRSIGLLTDRIEGRDPADGSGAARIVIEPQLIVRSSSSPSSL